MPTKSGTLTRLIAIDALGHVLTRNTHADQALDKLFSQHSENLSALDRSFVFEMVYGSLRWLAKMDWILKHMLDRPFSSLDTRVVNALRVGTYQIFYMEKVPDRAAVSETVEALKKMGMSKASSFINAVLRRVAARAEYFPKPDKVKERADYLSMHYSHPKWMVERWMSWISSPRLEYLLEGNNEHSRFVLKEIKKNPIPSGENLGTYLLREHGLESRTCALPQAWIVEKLPPLGKCEAFANGCYQIQEEAAQVTVNLIKVQPHQKVLDACGAPGGKSIGLLDAGLLPENLTVLDLSQKRIVRLMENLTRCKAGPVKVEHKNALDFALANQGKLKFDKVVLDAPCSATGVIRKHPEIKWLRHLADVKKCATEQEQLLNGLAELVDLGGEMIYIVCSIEKEETTDQVDRFLESHPQFRLLPLEGRIHDYYRKYLNPAGCFLSLPGNSDKLEGFFAAVFRREA
jgi:16S rRNA (cytosine967-C5)-methyltransferase